MKNRALISRTKIRSNRRTSATHWRYGSRLQRRGLNGGADHRVESHAGIQHQVVDAIVVPYRAIEMLDILRAPLIGCRQFPLRQVGFARKSLLKPADLARCRGIDKDMETAR